MSPTTHTLGSGTTHGPGMTREIPLVELAHPLARQRPHRRILQSSGAFWVALLACLKALCLVSMLGVLRSQHFDRRVVCLVVLHVQTSFYNPGVHQCFFK